MYYEENKNKFQEPKKEPLTNDSQQIDLFQAIGITRDSKGVKISLGAEL